MNTENVASSAPVHQLVGQLLPCPFCGCEAKYKTYGQDGRWAFHEVNCPSCGAMQMMYQWSPDEVIRRWNSRRTDVSHLQLMATNAGFKYWRASDAHGVTGTKEQAESFISDLIGVEAEICLPNSAIDGQPSAHCSQLAAGGEVGPAASADLRALADTIERGADGAVTDTLWHTKTETAVDALRRLAGEVGP